ncbi:MAG: Hsp20/alpha crystallin family protein [bacterium]|nr:Hsp20/alpha crystallin family protein [bacterium]
MVNLLLKQSTLPERQLRAAWPFLPDLDKEFFSNLPIWMRDTGESINDKAWSPSVDIIEKPDGWIFKAELPEVKLEDISVTVEDGILSIKGERKFEEEIKEEHYTRIERQYGSFERRFSLPAGIDEEGVKADYRNGVLTLKVPKKEEVKPKSVRIEVK